MPCNTVTQPPESRPRVDSTITTADVTVDAGLALLVSRLTADKDSNRTFPNQLHSPVYVRSTLFTAPLGRGDWGALLVCRGGNWSSPAPAMDVMASPHRSLSWMRAWYSHSVLPALNLPAIPSSCNSHLVLVDLSHASWPCPKATFWAIFCVVLLPALGCRTCSVPVPVPSQPLPRPCLLHVLKLHCCSCCCDLRWAMAILKVSTAERIIPFSLVLPSHLAPGHSPL